MLIFMLILGFVSSSAVDIANAATPTVVFDCLSEVEIDIGEIEEVRMTVESRGADFVAYLVGTSQPGPFPASKQVLPLHEGLQAAGIQDILSKFNLSSADRSKIDSVVVYTQGNFDDDAAGVRGAEFIDSQSGIVAKGMFFGWGGPVVCK